MGEPSGQQISVRTPVVTEPASTLEIARFNVAGADETPRFDHGVLPPVDVSHQFWVNDAYGRGVVDADGTIRWINAAALAMIGYPADAVVGRNMADFIAPDEVAIAIEAITEIQLERSALEEGVPLILALRSSDGSLVQVEIGAESYLNVPGVDAISLRLRPYDSQWYLERFLTALVAGAPVDDNLTLLTQSLDHLIQQSESAIVYGWDGTAFSDMVTARLPGTLTGLVDLTPADRDRLPWVRCQVSGEIECAGAADLPDPIRSLATGRGLQACWATPIVVPHQGVMAVLVVWRRLATPPRVGHRHALERSGQAAALAFERHRVERQLIRAATFDQLTGIPNRSQFFASLEVSMDTSEPGRVGVLYLDLDGFKPVNDTHGHRIGDRLLAEIGALLGANVRPGDLVARLGGDEFAVLCADVGGEAELCEVADRLIRVIAEPLVLEGIEVTIGVSIGIAIAQIHGRTQDEVLDSADAAMYRAKRAGRGRYRVAQAS